MSVRHFTSALFIPVFLALSPVCNSCRWLSNCFRCVNAMGGIQANPCTYYTDCSGKLLSRVTRVYVIIASALYIQADLGLLWDWLIIQTYWIGCLNACLTLPRLYRNFIWKWFRAAYLFVSSFFICFGVVSFTSARLIHPTDQNKFSKTFVVFFSMPYPSSCILFSACVPTP
jgi:hypothetical protein